jgi:hypothetical protein
MFAALAGLAAGLVHVLAGPDHLVAVAPLAAAPQRKQWQAGLQWGVGHTAGVLLIGVLLVTARHLLPVHDLSNAGERLVGVALLLVAVWTFARARASTPHVHATRGASVLMGALHGVAGSSHLFGILPALALPTQTSALMYLAGFGGGAILGMTLFAAAIGVLAGGAARRGINTYRGLMYVCSVCAFAVGSFWLIA